MPPGILPGSLYHHFESKEAILVELVRRYHADLDRIGKMALDKLDEPDSRPGRRRSSSWVRRSRARGQHRAAFQMSFYEAPSANQELVKLLRHPPDRGPAGHAAIAAGRQVERLHQADIDLPTLADRICQSMMHVGLDIIRHNAAPDQAATVLCRIMLTALPPAGSDAELDRSGAFAVAEEAIETWTDERASRRSQPTKPPMSVRWHERIRPQGI